jgi:hypothetical protein
VSEHSADVDDHASAPGEPAAEPPAQPPQSGSDAALARYRKSMRRSRTIYYAVLAVIVAAMGTFVGVVWSHSEVAHASLHSVGSAPPTVALGSPSQTQQQAWRTTDRVALGAPTWGGTVVTFSAHTVGGRDARTGKRTWSYTRTDRAVCTAVQLTGTTIAVYRNGGNCDEVSAFDSGTGQRRWTRTLDMDGMPLDGQPTYQFTSFTLLVASSDVVYAVDPVTGLNRWTYQRYGCRIEHVALGAGGALISQNCSAAVRCTNVKFCGRGPQLLLRDGSAAQGDDNKPNADQIKWNKLGDDTVPVSADQIISSVDPDGRTLRVFDATKGSTTGTVTLDPASDRLGPVSAIATSGPELVWLSGRTYAIRSGSDTPDWSTASPSPPTVSSTVDEETPTPATARITVPTGSGIAILDGNDGRVINRFAVQAPPAGSLVYSLGTGFLVAAPNGAVAYR